MAEEDMAEGQEPNMQDTTGRMLEEAFPHLTFPLDWGDMSEEYQRGYMRGLRMGHWRGQMNTLGQMADRIAEDRDVSPDVIDAIVEALRGSRQAVEDAGPAGELPNDPCVQLLALRAEKQAERDRCFGVVRDLAEFIQRSPAEGILLDQQEPLRRFKEAERQLAEIDWQIREAGCDS